MSMQPSWSRHISPMAQTLSRNLIEDFCIQPGSNLSFFLEVDSKYDNYESVRIWVQRMLDYVISDPFDIFSILTRLFNKYVPAEY